MSHEDLPIFNFPKHEKVLKSIIKGLKGNYRVDFIRIRCQRSLSQNAFLHGVVFVYAAKGLSDLWGMRVSMFDAKEHYKMKFLKRERMNPATGEVIPNSAYVEHTSNLNVAECSEFIEKVIQDVQDELGVPVPAAEEFAEV